ncbi:uncharacterized protein [Rutidosis leptorrhynchoides]|uniref:uncharacterized protein n=1 Tax=Rutidosis leptorrhynchoides TaxID=125765 RepID=UPI003A997A2F
MKPTASHLSKKTKECDIHSGGSGRLQKSLASAVEKLQSPIRSQNQATKRQKLEIGYMRKVAQLKHRTSFLHKFTKKAADLEGGSKTRVKSTTIRKSALVMKERAQRHRSQNKSESVQQPKANTQLSRARSLNRKTLDPPRLPQCKKSISQSTEFQPQVLNKHNSAPLARDNSLIKSQNSLKKDKCRSPINLKACTTNKVHPVKDGGLALNAKHNSDLPLTELFEKLSLKCESETKVLCSSRPPRVTKALKENVPIPFQL